MSQSQSVKIWARREESLWDNLPLGPQAFARRVLKGPMVELAPPAAEVSVLFTSDRRIRQLNRAYRNLDRPTDVLAFALTEGPDDPEESKTCLGDIVVSLDAARRQARERGVAPRHEIALLLIHGLLHLLGHDHDEPNAERLMRAVEDGWLGRLGFAPSHGPAGLA